MDDVDIQTFSLLLNVMDYHMDYLFFAKLIKLTFTHSIQINNNKLESYNHEPDTRINYPFRQRH